jgi:hypothetical protein
MRHNTRSWHLRDEIALARIKYETPEPWCDLSFSTGIQKAEFMAQSYASSFYAGADRHFHFILGHYRETRSKVQFGDKPIHGTIAVSHCPSLWKLSPRQWTVTLKPMERKRLNLRLVKPNNSSTESSDNWIKLNGDFGAEEQPVLAFRCISKPGEGYPDKRIGR